MTCVDVGGTSLTAALVEDGQVTPEVRRRTGAPLEPGALIESLVALVGRLPSTGRVAVGFPGAVEEGRVGSADNLGSASSWVGFDLAGELRGAIGGEVRMANDADLAALGCAEGRGVELCVTLGSGVGTGLVVDGVLQHHLELSRLPLGGSTSLDAHVGEPARKLLEQSTWNDRCVAMLELLDRVVRPDRLFLAGGNARRVRRSSLGPLQGRLWVVSEPVGLLGGEHLYR